MITIPPQPARIPRPQASRLVVFAVLLCAASLAGCGKKDRILNATGQQQPIYQPNQLPEVVLQNLALAYKNRDSTEYKSLFDKDYQGTSIDQKDPSPQLLTYTKADEAAHIAGLAKSTTVTDVDVQLGALIRLTDAGDPPGWALLQNPIFSVDISNSPPLDSWRITGADETIEFRFIPTLDSSSPTDTTWKIIKWTEIRF